MTEGTYQVGQIILTRTMVNDDIIISYDAEGDCADDLTIALGTLELGKDSAKAFLEPEATDNA